MFPSVLSAFRRRTVVAAAAIAIVVGLVALLLVVGSQGHEADRAHGEGRDRELAMQALADIAGAQAVSKERNGSFTSYSPDAGDRSLEASGHTIRRDGISDVQSIACRDGWMAAARTGTETYLRSSSRADVVKVADAVTVADAAERPDCISPFAVERMLADVGAASVEAAPAGISFTRPAEDKGYRPSYHLTPEQRWMNDPQRPFFLDGVWHYYYLYNADYPQGNGTEWFHVTSTDLVHWKDEGVAIQKYKNGLGDIETGSAVVDHDNTAGFGKDAVIALLTQQDDGVQRQSLFYSTDGGYSFKEHDGNPVMDNPGAKDWRDPKVIRDEANNQWVMVLAEGHKLGIYTSKDLKSWTYVSGFERTGLGALECPDLFQMDVDGDPSKRTWVLAASANGAEEGRTTGVAYWTGTWDGATFTPTDQQHQWLDAGADFYATVTWDDPRLTESQRMASRHAIGWMNNWTYARDLPTDGWHGGADTIVRDLRLATIEGTPRLVSTPTPALRSLEGHPIDVDERKFGRDGAAGLPVPETGAYKLDVQFQRQHGEDGSQAFLELRNGDKVFAKLDYDFESRMLSLTREPDAGGAMEKESAASTYKEARRVGIEPKDGSVSLTVYVDYGSVEVFASGGEETLTSLVFPHDGAPSFGVASGGGELTLKSLRYTPLAAAK
ncbi:glycoside hydrolase family 32 protein [Arthrobacter sp. ISL-30]|uniref:glycoside hydrolase family 32 protein n=1 Tax=Arthrobacter sp. ISL-30 TaxID=2819109 RepID=UPI001BEA1BD0|nr:glycoside hydrolase family 32 protein [Arthrobacter sp. ISL-30]MBT2515295.1 glycoside hydrolase family 32 protein [Arthrobacter sp. ISL-30]